MADKDENQFERNVWCLLGIPVDAISYDDALSSIHAAVQSGTPCFFSTPNLNFIVESKRNQAFRESVCRSNLVLLDGNLPTYGACGGCTGAPSFAGLSAAADLDPCADTGVHVRLQLSGCG